MNDLSVTHRHVPVTVPTTEQTEKECVTGKDAGILPEDPLANTEGGGVDFEAEKGGVGDTGKVQTLMEKMTQSPDYEVTAKDVKTAKAKGYKNITDITTQRYVKLYDRAIEQLGGKNVATVKMTRNFFLFRKTYYFSVTREGDHVAIIPIKGSYNYKELFAKPEMLGQGAGGFVARTDALFIKKTKDSGLLFKKAQVALKSAENQLEEANKPASSGTIVERERAIEVGRKKADLLSDKENDAVLAKGFLADVEGAASVTEIQDRGSIKQGISVKERVKACANIFRGTRQLNDAHLKHLDSKRANVLVGEDGQAVVSDIDGDLYLPTDIEKMTYKELADKFKEMGMIDENGALPPVHTLPYHLIGSHSMRVKYMPILNEVCKNAQSTKPLSADFQEQYKEMVDQVDRSVKQAACITAITILLDKENTMPEKGEGVNLPGFSSVKKGMGRYLKLDNPKELREALEAVLPEEGRDEVINLLIETLQTTEGPGPSLESLETTFSNYTNKNE